MSGFIPAPGGGSVSSQYAKTLKHLAALTHTGDTTETTVATVVIPGGTVTTGCRLLLDGLGNGGANDASSKLLRMKIGGTTVAQISFASANGVKFQKSYYIANAANSTWHTSNATNEQGASNAALVEQTGINWAADQTITFTLQNAANGDSLTIRALTLLLFGPGTL